MIGFKKDINTSDVKGCLNLNLSNILLFFVFTGDTLFCTLYTSVSWVLQDDLIDIIFKTRKRDNDIALLLNTACAITWVMQITLVLLDD